MRAPSLLTLSSPRRRSSARPSLRPRLTALAAAVAVGLVVPAGATAAAAAPARAAMTAVKLGCAGDTVSGSVTVRASAATTVRVELHATRGGGSTFTPTGKATTLAVTPSRTAYTWSFNVASLPATVTRYRAVLRTAGASETSNVVPAAQCAPGQEVPEAPVALLVPLTLAATGAGVLALRRGQGALPV